MTTGIKQGGALDLFLVILMYYNLMCGDTTKMRRLLFFEHSLAFSKALKVILSITNTKRFLQFSTLVQVIVKLTHNISTLSQYITVSCSYWCIPHSLLTMERKNCII